MRTLLTALASVLLLLAGSCTSPLATLKVGLPALPPVGPGETQLVFHLNSSARALDFYTTYSESEIHYLVVQLHSKYGQGSKFASVAVTGPTVAVNIKGLVAGPWELLVSAYDWDGVTGTNSPWTGSQDNTQPTLLYTGMDEMSIKPGTSTSVTLFLYKPGDLGNVTVTEAKMVNQVVISPMPPLAAIPASVSAGSGSFQVTATTWNVLNSIPASDSRISWYTDNPDVAFVDNAGNVFPKNPGTTKITARSWESEKYGTDKFAQFTLTVEQPLVGLWKAYVTTPTAGYRYALIKSSGAGFEIRYLTDVESNTGPNHYISTLTSSGASTWQFNTARRFDFPTNSEMVSGGSNYALNVLNNNQIEISYMNPTPMDTLTYDRVGNPVSVSSISLPAGPMKTGQTLNGKDLIVPGNPSVGQVYFSYSGGMVYSMTPYTSLRFDSAGSITVTARSVFDPSKFDSKTYTVDLAAPMPGNLTAPVANVTDTSIHLTWTYMNPGSLPGVTILRSIDHGATFTPLATSLGVDYYDDMALTPGQEYQYQLFAQGGFSGSTYVDSVPTKVLSAYTTSGGVPVVVSGPSFNPSNSWMNDGNGIQVPSVHVSTPTPADYGAQGFDNTATPTSNLLWLRAGDALWMVYSLPLSGAPAATVVTKYQNGMFYGSLTVSGVSKVWSIAGPAGNQFTLNGAGPSTGTITWNPPTMDFLTP